MTFLRFGLTVVVMWSLIHTSAQAQSVLNGTGNWNADSLSNHRAVIRVDARQGSGGDSRTLAAPRRVARG